MNQDGDIFYYFKSIFGVIGTLHFSERINHRCKPKSNRCTCTLYYPETWSQFLYKTSITVRVMKETRAKNGIKPSGDYGMWFVGGVPHRETDRMEKTISLLHRIFPVPWQHSFRDAGGAGHMFYSTVIVKAISLFLADPKLGECVKYIWGCNKGDRNYWGVNELCVVRVSVIVQMFDEELGWLITAQEV